MTDKHSHNKLFEDLVKALASDNPETRSHAISKLSRLEDDRVPALLIQGLRDETIRVRVSAVGGILSRLYFSENPVVFSSLEPTCYIEPLAKLIQNEQTDITLYDKTVIWCAVQVLGRIDDPRIFPLLAGLAKSSNPRSREPAAEMLGHVGDVNAINILASLVKDKDVRVRWIAVTQLGQINDDRVIEPLLSALGDNGHLYPLHAETVVHTSVEDEAWRALQNRNVPVEQIENRLLAMLNNPESDVQVNAAILLGRISKLNDQAVEILLNSLKQKVGQSQSLRYDVVRTLAAVGDLRCIPLLMRHLRVSFMAHGRVGSVFIKVERMQIEQALREILSQHYETDEAKIYFDKIMQLVQK